MVWTIKMTMVTLVAVAFFPGLVMPEIQGMAAMMVKANMLRQLLYC